MPPRVMTIADQLKEHSERAKAIIAVATNQDRDLTEAEASELDSINASMEKLAAKRARTDGLAQRMAKLNEHTAAANLSPLAHLLGGTSPTMGQQITGHPAFQEFLARRGGGMPATSAPFEIEAAVYAPVSPFPPTTVAPPPTVPMPPFGPYSARDLFTSLPASGGSVPYLVDTPPTSGAADVVLPGAAKPELSLQPTLKDDPLVKIAAWTGVANEVLDDAVGFQAWVNSILALSVLDREDVYISNVLVALPGKVADRPAASGENAADAILAQAMLVQAASKLPVDGCIVASDTFAHLVTMKAVGGGGYLVGSPLGAPTSTLWGQLRLAVSVNVPSGQAVVGSFSRGGAIYRKAALRIDLSESHEDFFARNLVAIRAEQRELLAIFKPLAFGLATGLLTTPA